MALSSSSYVQSLCTPLAPLSCLTYDALSLQTHPLPRIRPQSGGWCTAYETASADRATFNHISFWIISHISASLLPACRSIANWMMVRDVVIQLPLRLEFFLTCFALLRCKSREFQITVERHLKEHKNSRKPQKVITASKKMRRDEEERTRLVGFAR